MLVLCLSRSGRQFLKTAGQSGKSWNPTISAAETYTLPGDMKEADALAYWLSPNHEVFVADQDGEVVATYYLRPNQQGPGSHIANCGYITAPLASGRGIARAMCQHSLEVAKARGFLAMQFNFVVSTNTAAVHLWQTLGFQIVGEIPEAFRHPAKGLVSAHMMYRKL